MAVKAQAEKPKQAPPVQASEGAPSQPEKVSGPEQVRRATLPGQAAAAPGEMAPMKVAPGRPGEAEGTIQRQPRANAPPISTPLPAGTRRNRQGAATLVSGGLPVTILPDNRSGERRMRDRAETTARLRWGTPAFRPRRGVVEWVGRTPQPTLTIRSTYGQGVTRQSTSGYGRGTTQADIAAGQTSLRHHEGSHGQDYLDYLQNNPLPQFTGQVGMSVDEFQQAVQDYNAAMQQYQADMEAQSHQATDCVGVPGEDCQP